MRKHGWQLPYHPLQVVAVAVFLALGFAYYVFFAPFVGPKVYQFIAIGIYTPLIASAFGLYISCAATDPADSGVFRSKKYLEGFHGREGFSGKKFPDSLSSEDRDSVAGGGRTVEEKMKSSPSWLLPFSPLISLVDCCCTSGKPSLHQCEEGMFYCSLCEVEVFKYSKHCRVCDKCVDHFDHHCRWLNNCIGKRNYAKFFALMVSALLLLLVQWATGILVLVLCFHDRKRYSSVVPSKLGSSFSLVPFIIVVGVCSILAMVATLPLAQLFFFHVLLIKKGISTYDYIIALRDQEQEQRGQQSPQMSPISSLTGLSSASSFTAFHRAAWCTPPRLFLEDQFDVVPPETASVSSLGKKPVKEEAKTKKTVAPVKISPWTLARLDPEEVSKAAAEARKKSKILHPVDGEGSLGKRKHVQASLAEPAGKAAGFLGTSSSLVPLQLEARSAFQTSRAMSGSARIVTYSPESSLDSPDILPFRISSFGETESNTMPGIPPANSTSPMDVDHPLSRSTSDGYEASGGEDSDRIPSRIVPRSTNWSNLFLRADQDDGIARLKAAASSRQLG